MKKFFFILFILATALGGGLAWFWSLGALPAEAARVATLRVESQGVSVREPLRGSWESAMDGMEIGEGWSVKTDENGRAAIVVADLGESRLDWNTEVTITKATLDPAGVGVVVECSLAAGRLWTRVLRLFDLGSSYAVKTNAVVATVRGTSFDLIAGATSTILTVADSAVDVVPIGGVVTTSSDAVPAGTVSTYARDGRKLAARDVTDTEEGEAWFADNVRADRDFDVRAVASRAEGVRALGGVVPGSAFEGASRLSERAHLAVARGAARDRLVERYAARRVMQIVALASGGKSGQAAQEFARLENELKSASDAERAPFRVALARVALLVLSAETDSPLFAFRQRFESLFAAVSEAGASSGVFARLTAIEDRLDEAERFIVSGALEEAGIALAGAKSGIENVVRETEPLLSEFAPEDRAAVEGKIAAFRVRAAVASARLSRAMSGMGEVTTSTSALPFESATSTPFVATSSEVGPPSDSVTEEPEIVSIRVSASPDPLPIGTKGAVRVIAVYSDGSTENVSARSQVSVRDDGIARVNGLELSGVEEGATMITGSFGVSSGEIFKASAQVTVKGSAVPVDLALAASNGTVLEPGEQTVLAATVRYGDGTKKVVTSNTAFILEPSSVGGLAGAAFDSSVTGFATVTATYTENGKTVSASLSLTVTSAVGVSTSTEE